MKFRFFALLAAACLCTNVSAQITFERCYAYGQQNWFNDVTQTSDSGFIMTGGQSVGNVAGTYVVRTDANGDTAWTRLFSGTAGGQCGFGTIQSSDGNFVVCGYKNFNSSSDCKMHLVKLNIQGDTIWEITAGSSGCQWGQSVAQTWNGNYLVGGSPSFKRGASGQYLPFSLSNPGQIMSITKTADSGFVVSSFYQNTIYLQRLDTAGAQVWIKPYPGTMFNPHSHSVQQTQDGGFILAAEDPSFAGAMIVKTDANGDTLWTKHYWDTDATSVTQTSDGGYAYTGSSWYANGNIIDLLLVRLDANGDTLWKHAFGQAFDQSRGLSIRETSDRGFIISGYGADSTGAWYSLLVKTDSLGNAQPFTSAVPEQQLVTTSVFPNPFGESTTISCGGPGNVNGARLYIYDMLGNLVREQPVEAREIIVTRDGLPGGMYYFRLENSGNVIGSGKFVVQ